MWYATAPMSQSGSVWTPRREPSLIDMTTTLLCSMATMVCRTAPPSMRWAAPMVRLASPDTMVARSALEPRGVRPRCGGTVSGGGAGGAGSEESRSSPSEETTATERMPGTSSTRLPSSQRRLRASLLRPVDLLAPWASVPVVALTCVPPRLCPPFLVPSLLPRR